MTDNLNLGTIDLGTDDEFIARHIGPRAADTQAMLQRLGYDSLDTLIGNVIPDSIKGSSVLDLPAGMGEAEALASLKAIAARNRALRSFIGQGYYNCHPRHRSCATSWRTRPGTPPTRRTSRKSPRAAWRRC